MTIIVENYMIILGLLVIVYVVSAIMCYGLMLPYVETLIINHYDKPYKGRGIEKLSLYLSLLGPLGLYSFIFATESRYCGFRFYRKYLRYIKDEHTEETL